MTVRQLEFLVEEASMDACLRQIVPRIAPGVPFDVRVFRGKQDLIAKLPGRLAGYRAWPNQTELAVVVVIDRDNDECHSLRDALDTAARSAGLSVASPGAGRGGAVLNRIVVEELEAWFFGDIPALVHSYGVSPSLGDRAKYRDPDAVRGGTWEALERELKSHGHPGGLEKIRAAKEISANMDVEANRSASFCMFRDGLRFLVGAA